LIFAVNLLQNSQKHIQMKKQLIYLSLIVALILVPVLNAIGQPPPPPPQDIPIDGGLLFLLFAGVSYAVKQMFFNKNKKEM